MSIEEGEGGGTVLLVRGSLAAELGLPVYAAVAHAASYGDGAHTSIPAPGLGALGAGTGGVDSTLARSLRGLGLSPNDVTALSKHDTSTHANDPNESELHSILWPAIGRDPHQPMSVISQKTLTAHSKAGAALFQTGGIIDVFRTCRIPANVSLDCVDPLIAPKARNLVWLREPLQLPEVKAAALTSLGFGHVGALVATLLRPHINQVAPDNSGGDCLVPFLEDRVQVALLASAQHECQSENYGDDCNGSDGCNSCHTCVGEHSLLRLSFRHHICSGGGWLHALEL